MENLPLIAVSVITTGILSLFFLLILHFVSPEYKLSWRMVSEYAYGKYTWLLTLFFFGWGISSILLSILLLNTVTSNWAKVGVLFLFISGTGAIMGGLFDIKHKHHGLSFLLGIPTLIIGSLLIAYNLISMEGWQMYTSEILFASHLIWISCVLMGVSMGIMFSGFKNAGIVWDKDSEPPTEVPKGVIAVGGYANRILVLCYVGWNLVIALIYLQMN
jgi:hypothetical protein